MINDLIAEARGKYKSLDGVVVVSPKLLARLADALENDGITAREDLAYIKHLEAIIKRLEAGGAYVHRATDERVHSVAIE